ncbi:MAG: acetoin utilization protein AcuC [Actinobacteria bacterium]|nr:acetoin utilization protein AcuC [Actinomycetota bacterium]
MGERVAVVFGDGYRGYRFSETHPLNPVRVELAVNLIESYRLLESPGVRKVEPRRAADEEIQLIHDARYVDAVKSAEIGASPADILLNFGLGPGDNPIFPNMHEASSWIVGGSLVAAEMVKNKEVDHAFNPAGGLHHALRDKASGFCIYNDAAVACAYLGRSGLRVAYIDVDAHHGDGVQWAFYDSPEVLTISIHETGRFLFPGTGFVSELGEGKGRGYSVNIPLPPGCFDDAYIAAFREVVPPILRAFSPDIIVSQNGCDGHYNDPLTHLSLTTRLYREVYRDIHALAHEICGGRLIALGGGGYDLYDAVPRIWTLLFSELTGTDISERLPESWLKVCRSKGGGLCPTDMHDFPLSIPPDLKTEVKSALDQTVTGIIEKVFPYYGLSPSGPND